MKKWLVFILWGSFVYGQIEEPVKWETSVISDTNKNIYTITFKANIEKNWHLYSQFSDPNGAIPTEFKFNKNKGYRLIGRVNVTEPTVAYDEVFEMDLTYFNEKAIFKQKIEIIDKNLNNTDDWKLFSEAFNNADKGFIKKVKSIHPDLTPNDLRLCAYLRLNLPSKEIAPLLNISHRSVEVKRYRLRKKMNLDHKQNLTDYILNL